MRRPQRLLKRQRCTRRLRRAAQHADKVAAVVQLGGRHGAHLPALHEGLGIVFGQKADEAPRQDQRGNRLLVERRGPALQVAAVRQRASSFSASTSPTPRFSPTVIW